MDDAVLMQYQKIHLICPILISNCLSGSTNKNEYQHFMFVTTNNEVIWGLK